MFKKILPIALSCILFSFFNTAKSQCPNNISFDANNLSFWTFKTGSFSGFNANSADYGATYTSANTSNPVPANVTTLKYIPSSVTSSYNGVRVIKANPDNTPIYDSVITGNVIKQVPKINGYQYTNSVKLGNNYASRGAEQLVYRLQVPSTNSDGSTLTTYNITYAYALILQAAGHAEDAQPRFNATVNDLSQPSGSQKIECASKQYFVPTLNNDPTWINGGNSMYKDWQEVSFDLSQYAGKTIELKFSVVDCNAGGHYGYAYIALRNDGCGSGDITGPTTICSSSSASLTYSTATVDQASYTWTFPTGWIVSGTSTSSSVIVIPNSNSGNVTVTPSQSCGNIVTRSINVSATASAPNSPGAISGSTSVCASSQNLSYRVDPVANATSYNWTLPSGATWVSGYNTNEITINAPSSTGTATISVAAVNNCNASSPSSNSVSINIGTISVGGSISPSNVAASCPTPTTLTLSGNNGSVLNWKSSIDGGVNWTTINSSSGNLSITVNPVKSSLYKAEIQSGACASIESSNSLVNIKSLPTILTQPTDIGVCSLTSTSFTTYATGDGLNYEWYVSTDDGTSYTSLTNTGIYTGTTTDVLSLNNTLTTSYNNYKYKVLVKGTCDNVGVYSSHALLNVYSGNAVSIIDQPANGSVCQGSATSLSVLASGPTLSYQWYSNNTNNNTGGSIISGQTRRTYTPSTTTSGTNYYYVKVTSSGGNCGTASLTTNYATLIISPTSTVSATISSTSGAICVGTNKTFTATALNEGTSPVYTWYKNGSVVSGQTSATYSTTGLSNGEAVYATVTSNKACAIGSPASSNTISTTVNALPSINTTTGSASVNVGSSILLANTTSNGTWSSAAPGIASVASGTVTGISEGNVNILYSVTDNQTPACTNTATKAITVYAQSPSGLSYITPNVYIKGTAITALNPTISGGAVTGYTITPSLPSGLVINSSTGIISGTPTVNSPATNYTVTATNSGGSVSALVNLSVNEPAPSGLSYTTPNVYTKGITITALNPTISGGAVTGYTITPSLPSGLVINSSTGIISGTPTVNSAATNYTVTASNSGGSVSAVLNITVKLDQPQGSISSVDYLLLKSDTVSLKLNVSDGTSPFSVILTNDQNNSKDTIVNLVDGAILKLKPLSKTTIFKLFKLIDANQSERASGFSKDTSIIRIAIPNLAMTLKAELPVKLPDNSFRTKLLLKLKNAGELGLKNVQVNANLSQVFPTYLNYVLDSIKLVSGNVKLNSNYTGKGTTTSSSNSKSNYQSSSIKSNASLDPNYLFDNGVNLAVSDEAEVQYFMSIAATPNNIILKLQFETEGQAAITKNDGTISQEVSKAVSDNGLNITAHPNITSIGTPVPTFLPLYPVEKIGASLSASNATPVAGGYTFDFVAKVKNYSNLNLDTVALINELSKTFTSPDTAYIINTPVVTGGVKFNTSFNGYSNTLLIDSTAKLAVGDSATIAYTLKVITDKINYTWLNSVIASGHSTLDYDFVKDISVEGSIPDPNVDGDPLEQTETRFSVSYIRPDAPTVNNAIYTFNTNYPTTIGGLVKTYPINSIPVWCDPATAICNPTAPITPLAIGKYVYYLKSYDSTTRLYSVNYVNDTVTIKPPVPKVIDSTYIIGLNGNPANVSVQVNVLSGSSVVYYSNGIKLSAIPQLGNVSGQYNYSASQIVNQVESDTVGFKVNMLNLNSVIHLQKLAGQAVLQSNSTFNIPFTFIVTNLLNKKLENIVITDNLLNSIYTPSTFNVINVSSTGGIIANKLFNGSTDIALTTIQSTLNPLSIDTVRLSLNILPYGFSGQLNNTAVINAKTPYGSISMNSSSSVLAGELSKNPTKYTIPELLINIPEGFSPNRDGVNDKFIIIKPFGTDLELEVFNRWGNVVYYNANYNNDWDGRGTNNFLGQDLMDGGYYYTLRAKDSKGNIQIFKGFVLIQR